MRTKFFFWPKIIFGLIFFRPKTMFGGRKQSFWTLSFLNWQRAKVLLKLEFDTEDQVLSSNQFVWYKSSRCLILRWSITGFNWARQTHHFVYKSCWSAKLVKIWYLLRLFVRIRLYIIPNHTMSYHIISHHSIPYHTQLLNHSKS